MPEKLFYIVCILTVIAVMWTHDDTYTLDQAIEINKIYQQQAKD